MNSLEVQEMTNLAEDNWQSVHAKDGELAIAESVINIGINHLHYLAKFRPWDSENAKSLEKDIRKLQQAAAQRENTADEFMNQAIDGLASLS